MELDTRETMMVRVRYKEAGAHTHVRVFAGPHVHALGLCGELTFRNDEWATLTRAIGVDPKGITRSRPLSRALSLDIVPEEAGE